MPASRKADRNPFLAVFLIPNLILRRRCEVVPGDPYRDRRTIHSMLHLCERFTPLIRNKLIPHKNKNGSPEGFGAAVLLQSGGESLISLLGLSRGVRLLQRTMATISMVS